MKPVSRLVAGVFLAVAAATGIVLAGGGPASADGTDSVRITDTTDSVRITAEQLDNREW
ncbi:hypothetical protein AB0M02_17170 [Actinoplanes sp. NPDC051861]|uniref:hypothetical protein n=1 Tax=Actinoplanes sp. NPDC051861 TaxID=3155170 RepID=UPI003430E1DE